MVTFSKNIRTSSKKTYKLFQLMASALIKKISENKVIPQKIMYIKLQ